jgi:hypothetical protein
MWRVLGIFGAIAAVVLLGVGLGWIGTRTPKTLPSTPPIATTSGIEEQIGISPAWPTNARIRRSATGTVATAQAEIAPGSLLATNLPATGVITNWEDKVDEILAAEVADEVKGRQMLEMFPRIPAEGQQEVAQHLANLVPDAEYGPLGRILADPASDADVQDVLIGDLLNRPNSMKMPLLLEVARTESHPKAGEARDILELFLEGDYGSDWTRWQTEMDKWLKDNPD